MELVVNNQPPFVWGTTVGLKKNTNEDFIEASCTNGVVRFCVCDGHWGHDAAQVVGNFWLGDVLRFPESKEAAISLTKKIEEKLFGMFGYKHMNPEQDFSPETAFISGEVRDGYLTAVSYGDCGLIIVEDGNLLYSALKRQTWLGAFSYLGVRHRISVEEGVVFIKTPLTENTRVCAFTDGIDECIYEKITITHEELANLCTAGDMLSCMQNVMQKVENYGAEDNASLLIVGKV